MAKAKQATGKATKATTIAAYVRVSTTGQNLAGQKREIEQWLNNHGLQSVFYEDKATGSNTKRPALERLRKDIFDGKVKTVVVWRLDRLSRSLKDGIALLCDWCEAGLRVVSVTQQIDFNGTIGKMLASVLLGVAEMERENIRERQRAGIEAAKEKGVYAGRQTGTTKAKPARARELRAKGLNDSEIATALGVSRSTVQRYHKQAKQ